MPRGAAIKREVRREDGSASLELVGVLPFLLLAILVAAQLAIAGHSLWSAAVAARREARSELVRGSGGAVSAGVTVPSVLPGMPPLRVEARTSLGGR